MKNTKQNNDDALIQAAIAKINEAKNSACAGFDSPQADALWATARAVKKEQALIVRDMLEDVKPEDRDRLEADEAARVGKFLSDLPEGKLALPESTVDSLRLDKLHREEADANGGYVAANGEGIPVRLIPCDEFGVPLVEPSASRNLKTSALDNATSTPSSRSGYECPKYARVDIAAPLIGISVEQVIAWAAEGKVRRVEDIVMDDHTVLYNTADLLGAKFHKDEAVAAEWDGWDDAQLERAEDAVRVDKDHGYSVGTVADEGSRYETEADGDTRPTAADLDKAIAEGLAYVHPGWGTEYTRPDGLDGTTITLANINAAVELGNMKDGYPEAESLLNSYLAQVSNEDWLFKEALEVVLKGLHRIGTVTKPNHDYPVDWPITEQDIHIIALNKKIEAAMQFLANDDEFVR